MMHFTTEALRNKHIQTEEEWRDFVSRDWSMECAFDCGVGHQLLATSWFMGDLRFEVADLSGQQWTWKPGPGVDNWRRNTLVIFLIESGVIELEQDGAAATLTAGSLLLFDPSISYTQTSGRNSRGMTLRVSKASLEKRGKVLSSHQMFVPNPASPDVTLLKSLLAGATAYGEQCSSYGRTLVAEHLTDLMEIISDDLTAPKRVLSSDVMLRKVKRFIERNVGNENLDPDTVANSLGISRRYLTRLFERDGSSVMRYVLQQRLERAKRILTSGGAALRISDVAWQCGFVSAAHFSRAFKKQYGRSPTDLQGGHADAAHCAR
jgi:AraC-like DNA-binding protein